MSSQDSVEAFPQSKVPSVTLGTVSERTRKWWQLGGQDVSHVSIDAGYEASSPLPSASYKEDAGDDRDGIFVSPEAADVYKPVEGFEGAHRFVPSAKWSPEEEERLVTKVGAVTFVFVSGASRRLTRSASLIGRSRCRLASCSLLCSSIGATYPRHYRITCLVSTKGSNREILG